MLLQTRRAAIATAIPFATWFKAYGQPSFVRSDAYSPAGIAMLAKYATGVAKMRLTAETDATSWMFQWYTHAVRPDRGIAAELARVFPAPSPKKALAQDMWNTCQAHGFSVTPPQKEEYFLPWHRMFVYFFERIVRKACADPTFSLPYWNYSAPGANHGRIPPAFRAAGTLFEAKRRPWVNTGQPIDRISAINPAPNGTLNLSVLSEPSYNPGPARRGFCETLDFGLHGNVHVEVGGPTNMGSVPWAAEDPVFWMHHCNIDRLWASWNRNGGNNPVDAAFKNQKFIFADENGNKVSMAIGDVLSISPLHYSYDRLEPAPAGFHPTAAGAAPASAPSPTHRLVSLNATGAESKSAVKLVDNKPENYFSARIKNLPSARRMYLSLSGLSAKAQPGVIYGVYLNLPTNAAATGRDSYRVGHLSFFDAGGHEGHAGGSSSKKQVFDITDVARYVTKGGVKIEEPVVSLIPLGAPEAGAEAVVGEISILEQ